MSDKRVFADPVFTRDNHKLWGEAAMAFRLRFYADIIRYDDDAKPCRIHRLTYSTLPEAEAVAMDLMPEILAKFGPESGYAVMNDVNGLVEAIGPPRNADGTVVLPTRAPHYNDDDRLRQIQAVVSIALCDVDVEGMPRHKESTMFSKVFAVMHAELGARAAAALTQDEVDQAARVHHATIALYRQRWKKPTEEAQ